MISLDIETSGLDSGRCGIWQIGAVEVENPKNVFIEEARIDNEDEISEESLQITGKTKEEIRDKNKQSQKQLILNFIEFAKTCKEKIILGHNIGFDMSFLLNKCIRYDIIDNFRKVVGYKGIDTHSIAQIKHLKEKGKFSLNENGKSDMNLTNIMKFVGLKDTRRKFEGDGRALSEGTPHNALEDAKLTAECYRRLMKK